MVQKKRNGKKNTAKAMLAKNAMYAREYYVPILVFSFSFGSLNQY